MSIEWKPVKGYEGLYVVSNHGHILALEKTVNRGKCHRTWWQHYKSAGLDSKGYLRVSLSKEGRNKTHKVHRLVAEVFIPNPDNLPQVNHVNGIKTDNRVENLEWCTGSENMKHACKNGLKRLDGLNNPAHKLTLNDVEYIRSVYKARDKDFGAVALAKRFNVHRKTISRIALGQYWR